MHFRRLEQWRPPGGTKESSEIRKKLKVFFSFSNHLSCTVQHVKCSNCRILKVRTFVPERTSCDSWNLATVSWWRHNLCRPSGLCLLLSCVQELARAICGFAKGVTSQKLMLFGGGLDMGKFGNSRKSLKQWFQNFLYRQVMWYLLLGCLFFSVFVVDIYSYNQVFKMLWPVKVFFLRLFGTKSCSTYQQIYMGQSI